METQASVQDLLRILKDEAQLLENDWKEKRIPAAEQRARLVLSAASRLHQRFRIMQELERDGTI